ncbi:MAG TPA: hypothetical protein VH084_16470 [Mycobacterium sp.]|jgi:hypothetical protein|nr:hypothetical protein [Mycobacterium sp.]
MDATDAHARRFFLIVMAVRLERNDQTGGITMGVRIEWARFLIVTALTAITIFVLDIAFHSTLAAPLFGSYPAVDYPSRPQVAIMPLLPFLFVTYILLITAFCYLFLRLYPGRGLRKAAWWGIWGGSSSSSPTCSSSSRSTTRRGRCSSFK